MSFTCLKTADCCVIELCKQTVSDWGHKQGTKELLSHNKPRLSETFFMASRQYTAVYLHLWRRFILIPTGQRLTSLIISLSHICFFKMRCCIVVRGWTAPHMVCCCCRMTSCRSTRELCTLPVSTAALWASPLTWFISIKIWISVSMEKPPTPSMFHYSLIARSFKVFPAFNLTLYETCTLG